MRKRHVNHRQSGGEWAMVIIATTLLGVVITLGLGVYFLVRATSEQPAVVPTAVAALPTPVDFRSDFNSASLNNGQLVELVDGSKIILQPWDGESRFTILAMGLDRRPGEQGIAFRTDTMMLLSIDPVNQSVGILSIPRDLYVAVPGYGQPQRVNSPMVLGEITQPGYGPKLAMQTVQYNFGIRVHDYLLVDFNAFIGLVDTIGGIDIELDYNISDPQYPDMNYGYDPFYLRAGNHHLDGLTALKFARTRHGSSDFERAVRQQQVLYAIRDRVLSLELLPQLIVQAPNLLNALQDNVYTDLTLDQMIRLALYGKDIPAENIRTGVVNQSYSTPWMTEDGRAVLVPDRVRLGSLMVEVFGSDYSG